MRRIIRFASLSPGDQARLLVAGGLLVSLPVLVRIVGFSRLRGLLLWIGDTMDRFVPGDPAATRIATAVEAADRSIPGSRKCLIRSLTAEVLLCCYGLSPDHRLGVDKRSDGSLRAHSWIEFEDDVLIGDLDNLSQYEPLPSLDYGDNL